MKCNFGFEKEKYKIIVFLLLLSATAVFGSTNTTSMLSIKSGSTPKIIKIATENVRDTIDIDTKELLQINGIDITPMKITGRGKFMPTKSARSTDVMRINFQINDNKYITPGYKDVYILIQNPKGIILNRKGTFDVYGGNKLRFTEKTEAYYENDHLQISILTSKFIQKITKGIYTVTIYIENYPVGLEMIRLR